MTISFNFPQCPLNPGARVWTYQRDSGGDGQDQESQRLYIDAYLQHYGLIRVESFIDAATSSWAGSNKHRAGLERLMDMARSSPEPLVEAILFWDYDRLARDYNRGQWYLGELRTRGYQVFDISEYVAQGKYGGLFETLKLIVAQEESDKKSIQVRRGHLAIRQAKDEAGNYLGVWPQRVPRFFLRRKRQLRDEHGNPLRRNDGSPRIVNCISLDPAAAPLIRRAFELRAAGLAYADIERATGLFGDSRKNYSDQENKYARLFRNPLFKGVFIYREKLKDGTTFEHVFENFVEAAVSAELWAAAQQHNLDRPKKGSPWPAGRKHPRTGTSDSFLLSGEFLKCAYCAAPMYATKAKRGQGERVYYDHYYICQKKRKEWYDACENKLIRADKLEPTILQHARAVYPAHERIDQIVGLVNQMLAQGDNGQDHIEELRGKLSGLERKRANLIKALEDVSFDSVRQQLLLREQEIERLKRDLNILTTRSQSRLLVDRRLIQREVEEQMKLLDSQSIQIQKQILGRIIERIEAGVGFAVVTYSFPALGPLTQEFVGLWTRLPRQSQLNKYTIELPISARQAALTNS